MLIPLEAPVGCTTDLVPRARHGLLWLGLATVGMAAFHWSGFVSLAETWSRPEYSQGYLIPPIAAYLMLTRLDDKTGGGDGANWPGLVVVLFGLLVGLLGNLSQIPNITAYSLIICIGGLVLVTAGLRPGLRLWVPIVYLLFMLPLPNFLYWPLSIQLQLISSYIGVLVISTFGVPVYLDGNIIDLGVYQLQVAEACSGLRYLFPLLSFSFLFAVLYKGPVWHKLVLFISALPITVLMNSFRIGVIGVLVDRYGIEQAEGVLHVFEGWIIFIACVLLLYFEAFLLQRLVPRARPIREMLDLQPKLLIQRFGRIRGLGASRGLIAAAALILVAGVAWQLAPTRAPMLPQRTPLVLFPTDLDDWRGERRSLDANIERVLGADDYLVADYSGSVGIPVNFLVAYYHSQINGSGIHSPEVCLPTGGWEVSRWTRFQTGLNTSFGQPLTVNRAIIQKGMSLQLVYFWFEQRGRALTSDYAAKGYTVFDSIARGRTDGALVRLITPITTGDVMAADDRLLGFLVLLLAELPSYVPE